MKVNHEGASIRHTVVIHGLGGTGKSQLALRFAKDYKDRYDPILWINATNPDTTQSSFERYAAALGLAMDATATTGSALID
jgi:KaiC/GvpD/RAD55 family RecA-like ATPase